MGVILQSASGTQFGLIVNSDGTINTIVSGTILANLESVYVTSGNIFVQSGNVTLTNKDMYVVSGNIFITSGNAWVGVGSVFTVNSSASTFVSSGNVFVNSGNVTLTSNNFFMNSGNAFVNSGNMFIAEQVPTNANKNNPLYQYTYTSGNITQVVQFVGAGSYTQAWTWGGGSVLTAVGSWI